MLLYNVNAKADISVWDGYSYSYSWYTGGSNNVYHISTAADLAGFSRCFSMGYYLYGDFKGATVILDNDIDLNGYEWTPIGISNGNTSTSFKGTFDGNNHVVKGMSITKHNRYIGFFGNAFQNFSVKNLKIEGKITLTSGDIRVGGIVGYAGSMVGRIENCQTNVDISISAYSGAVYCGGIIGLSEMSNMDIISKNCYTKGKIQVQVGASNTYASHVGGIIGYIAGDISTNSRSSVICCQSDYEISISGSRNIHTGGIIGLVHGCKSIENAYFSGVIDLENSDYITGGGIAGTIFDSDFSITSCLVTGQIKKSKYWQSSAILGTESFNGTTFDAYYCYYLSGLSNNSSYGVSVSDSELKSGIPLEGFDTSIWDFKQGEYPSLKFLMPTLHSLDISASGYGSVTYNGTSMRNQTRSFTVNQGASATLVFSPDNGYRLGSVRVNNSDVTSSVYNNQYTINNISANTTVSVTFEQIPVTTYSLSISSSGNGSVTYGGTSTRNQTRSFTVNQGTSATLVFSPDNGYRLGSVRVNNSDVTSSVYNNQYVISNIRSSTTVSVTFVEEIKNLTYGGINYRVVNSSNRSVYVANGSYSNSLTVPASFYSQGYTWTVTGIDANVFTNNDIAAVVWNPSVAFTASVSNPNFLLYVTSQQYAPSSIKNVVVNGKASSITLSDAANGNSFYCPQEFTATNISYSHTYNMTTGIKECRGWETIALPFDVQTITHSYKGTLLPFANWNGQFGTRPFWLYQLGSDGWVAAGSIKANTPYIISMPNNNHYISEYRLNGSVTFFATNATVRRSNSLQTAVYGSRTFVPNFSNISPSSSYNVFYHVLNAVNEFSAYNGSSAEGSVFVRNLRNIHPFEAYLIVSGNNAKEAIPIFDDETTGIQGVEFLLPDKDNHKVYNLSGQQIKLDVKNGAQNPRKGIYIVNGKKIVIR